MIGVFKVTAETKNSVLNPTIIDLMNSYKIQMSKQFK